MTSPDIVTRSLRNILTETFDGPQQEWSHYLDKESPAGLLATLDALSAERASARPAAGRSSVAAHAGHLRFIVAGVNAALRGEQPSGDWKKSWAVSEVDAEVWSQLRGDLRREYAALLERLDGVPDWEEGWLTGAVGFVAHLAYHFGAIRQLIRLV